MGTRQNRLGEAVLTCTHNLCFEENTKHFILKIFIFYNFKNLCILHGHVFMMITISEKCQFNCIWDKFNLLNYREEAR